MNYEAPPGFNSLDMYVQVTDSGQLSFVKTLKLIVTDVNEPPRNIRILENVKSIPENFTVGKNIAQLWADNPEGVKQEVKFTLENYQDTFSIVQTHSPSAHSFIQLKRELDFDKQTRYVISILAEDNGSPKLQVIGTISFDVLRSDACITNQNYLCQQNASCTRITKNSVNCTCDVGFELDGSRQCVGINECKLSCDNCVENNYRNACRAGKEPPCSRCGNNGTCIDHHNNYTCQCAPGFIGRNCFLNYDDCASNPCTNGHCVDGIDSFKCVCYNGYNGTTCTEEINECTISKKPCYKGECRDLVASYTCDNCPDGYSGIQCERRTCSGDECLKNEVCHSVNLFNHEPAKRCISKLKLVELIFSSDFAILKR